MNLLPTDLRHGVDVNIANCCELNGCRAPKVIGNELALPPVVLLQDENSTRRDVWR